MRKIVVVAIVAALGLAGVVIYKRAGGADPVAAGGPGAASESAKPHARQKR